MAKRIKKVRIAEKIIFIIYKLSIKFLDRALQKLTKNY